MVNRITIWCVYFGLSAISAVFWPDLPSPIMQFSLALLSLLTLIVLGYSLRCHRSRQSEPLQKAKSNPVLLICTVVSGISTGALWMASVGYSYQSWQLPKDKIQQDVTINAEVVSGGCLNGEISGQKSGDSVASPNLPEYVSYTVWVTSIDGTFLSPARKMRLSQPLTQHCLHNGDEFSAIVKLKPAYGTLNPVGFNLQQYLVSQHVSATGYIKTLDMTSVVHNHSFRHKVSAFLAQLPLSQMRWFQALLLGERGLLTGDDWRLIQRTGTAHVFSISGMHLGIVALSALVLINGLLFIGRLGLGEGAGILNARYGVLLLLLLSTGAYVLLSGMALPVVRAYVLLTVAVMFAITRCVLRPIDSAAIMVIICLLLFPMSIFQASFYLSVGAVLSIWILNWRFRFRAMGWFQAAFVMQMGVTLAMAPMTMLWFESISLIGVLANLVVVPVITLILPIGLLALFLSYLSSFTFTFDIALMVLHAVDVVFSALLDFISLLASFPASALPLYPRLSALACMLSALVVVVLPHWRNKWLCVLLLMLPLLLTAVPDAGKNWYLHVLDAGQGNALAITRGANAILIDTGPAFNGKARVAETIIPAFLSQQNSAVVDLVIHSHGDADHAGGKEAIKAWLKERTLTPLWLSPTNGCEQGKVLLWQGLTLSFLWPKAGNNIDSNAMSCVVKVSDGTFSVLLPGDIERSTEYAILGHADNVHADVMVVPHHGSDTSSTDIWIKQVAPKLVIYTQGFENRWGFPSADVYARYQQYGIRQLTTSEYGYIRLEFDQDDYIVTSSRAGYNKRWYLPQHAPRHIAPREDTKSDVR